MIKRCTVLIFGGLLVAGAAEVHVNRWEGNDGNSGGAGSPVATLARGVGLLKAGDTLVVANGPEPYFEALNLGKLSGSADKPISVEGNGATLSGLVPMPAAEWDAQGDGTYRHQHKRWGALQPYLMDGEREIAKGSFGDLLPDSHCWTTNGVWFRPADGKKLEEYRLLGTLRVSGVFITSGSYIRIRNLVCERFANDGFNIHGGSRGLVFENIEGRFNGDDGFSIHEDVEAAVYGGQFHGNNFGIQDVNASQSIFHGVLAVSNRLAGIDFYGGYHSVFDSEVRDNGGNQISVVANLAAHIGFSNDNPMCKGLVFVKNTSIHGGCTGVRVGAGSRLVMKECSVRDLQTGLDVAAEGVCHAVKTAVEKCSDAAVRQADGAVVVWDGAAE
ncbi:MAG: right-handed parallel beta-helix repeat-containing protein [Kiritimatiellae bacterium]|nr:right-handed parallel beta-helix repeat-containing protein [Kiritimatiellia bacterium]MDD3544393.1 right-handed parallel beta-helix repeat-containing protein [Kiritimatiellia bacterium]MDD4024333.1 right-handed parallel beta-helix repeat-containing protein [Kiritimatiellia bacterium]MDD4621638.1 right-handed parallel beta-helix repeat-containing protein [Kiritimatiellia bacterium]